MVYINNSLNNTANQDFTVTTATAGVDRTLTISNSDNTAVASAAHGQITVGGSTSTGDPYLNFLVTAAGTFSLGIDNSDSDKLKITNGASTSAGTDLFYMDSSGNANFSAGSVAVYSSHAGALHSLEVYNTDQVNAASDTMISSRVYGLGGVSATGDPYLYVVVSGTNGYAIGIDNSDSDILKIVNNGSIAATPSTGNTLLSITPAGLVTVPYGDLSVTRSAAGAAVISTISNTDNTNAISHAKLDVTTGGDSGGDPYTFYTVTGTTSWSTGIDNSSSDSFAITVSGNPSSGTRVINCTTAGEITEPLQPSFLAYLSADAANITGDSTVATLVCNTEVFDQNSDYNNGTGIFTAPVTGRYRFSGHSLANNIGAGHTEAAVFLATHNRTYQSQHCSGAAVRSAANHAGLHLEVLADMDAGDTAAFQLDVQNSTKTVGSQGDATAVLTYFSGELVC